MFKRVGTRWPLDQNRLAACVSATKGIEIVDSTPFRDFPIQRQGCIPTQGEFLLLDARQAKTLSCTGNHRKIAQTWANGDRPFPMISGTIQVRETVDYRPLIGEDGRCLEFVCGGVHLPVSQALPS
jgi:hypothetical protein